MRNLEFVFIGIVFMTSFIFIILLFFGKASIHNEHAEIKTQQFLNDIGYNIIQLADKSTTTYQQPSIQKKKRPTKPSFTTSESDFHFFNLSNSFQ